MLGEEAKKESLMLDIESIMERNLINEFIELASKNNMSASDLEIILKSMQIGNKEFSVYTSLLLSDLITREYDKFEDVDFIYYNIVLLSLARLFVLDYDNYNRLTDYASYLLNDVLKEFPNVFSK